MPRFGRDIVRGCRRLEAVCSRYLSFARNGVKVNLPFAGEEG